MCWMWLISSMQPKRWDKIKGVTTVEEVEKAYEDAMQCMARLNRTAAQLMHQWDAHGATDVTGFGILGHATNLVQNQREGVSFVIHTLPILANMVKIFKSCGINFKLLEGFSAETSGRELLHTVEPRLTTTSLIRPPRYYDHFFLSRPNAQSFSCQKPPFNLTTSLMRPTTTFWNFLYKFTPLIKIHILKTWETMTFT